MQKPYSLKKRSVIFAILILLLSAAVATEGFLCFPNRILIFEGETLDTRFSSPYTLGIPASFGGVLSEDGSVTSEKHTRLAESVGSYNAELKLFGILPVRSVQVQVSPKQELIPCGNVIGIKIFTQGLVCVGTSELKAENGNVSNPGKENGIREGDIILSANEITLTNTDQFSDIIAASEGKEISLNVCRNEKQFSKHLLPVKTTDGYRLGLWVRDSTAGIGTLSFYDAANNCFGALGHPITDTDTGILMPVSNGAILNASVFQIKKGARGEPGEIKGMFQSEENLGTIHKNTKQGIFGTLRPELLPSSLQSLPLASRSQIKEGAASVLCCVDGNTVREYQIEIQRVMRYSSDNCKDLVIKVTDPSLLEATGGIVQGMSGSPILQNGKIVGAVTHVFVNDPTRGYGIFIENMLSEANDET